MSFDKNPETILALWATASEPVKAALFSLGLGILLAARSKDRGIIKKAIECATASLTAFGIGYICHLAGLPSWVIWAVNGAVVYMGVDRFRALVDSVFDRVVDKYLPAKDETQ